MGIVQRSALRIAVVMYVGLVLGYINKGVLFGKLLTLDQLGLINLSAQLGVMLGYLSTFGVTSVYGRFGAHFKDKENKDYGILTLSMLVNLCGIIFFSALLFFAKDWVVANYQEKSTLFVTYFNWILPIGISFSLYLVFDAYLKNIFKNVVSLVAFELCLRIFTILLILAFSLHYISFESFVILHALGYSIPVLVILVYLIYLKRLSFIFAKIAIPKRFRKILYRYTLITYLTVIGSMGAGTIDAIMIAKELGLADTAIYTTVVFLVGALLLPYKSISRVTMPLITQHWKHRRMKDLQELYVKTSSVNLVLFLYLFLGVWICKDELFSVLPANFKAGYGALFFFLITRAIDCYTGLNGYIFVTSKKYYLDVYLIITMLVLVFFMNVWLIPIYGMTGAAISTASALFLANGTRTLLLYRYYKLHPFKLKQLHITLLFLCVLGLFEIFPIQFHSMLLGIIAKGIVISLLFLLPIYVFKWETEFNDYAAKLMRTVKRKVLK
jgi:O-antigen/teichoic acid export membrane protein